MDCIFCKIINGEIPAKKIYEDEVVIAFLDVNPDSFGHTLIIPKKHYCDLSDIDIQTITHIMNVAKELMLKMKNKLNYDGLTLIQNNGAVQEVKHFHLHLKPFYKNKNIEEAYQLLK